MKSANIFDLLVIAGYFLFMLGIGVYFMKINKTGREYFVGGNMIPWWVSGMTLYMANFSAWTFTGAAGMTYSAGPFMLLWFCTGGLAYFIGTTMTAKLWRRSRSISPVEYTYTRYNTTTQQFLSWVISVNFVLSAGVQLAATSKVLAPVMGFDITTVTIVTGVIILSYTFMGGVWAVSITDVVQGVILLATIILVVPLSLGLVGGVGNFLERLPPLTFDHLYNGVHYDEHWLISILIISSLGFAGGSGQRFYSVKDEASARKVGYFAGILALTGPIVFGVPPLVARIVWPDLSQVEFFKPYIGKNPQDLVYLALCLKFLPNGLIGVFVAAMLAATMSTLSSVYNMISSIVARDMVQGLFRRRTTDDQLLTIGRIASAGIGLTVTVLAVLFVNSQFGIFNMMQAFFTIFNIPVSIPMAFGLLFRRIPKWSAVGAISWGLLAGVTGRYLLAWDIGPQVYFSIIMTGSIFVSSLKTAEWYKSNKPLLALSCVVVAAAVALLFVRTAPDGSTPLLLGLALGAAAVFGASLFGFAALFTRESPEDRAAIAAFFKRLDTPVDVAREVFGAGKKQVSVFPLVGATMIVMAGLISLVFFTDLAPGEGIIVGALVGLMFVFGALMWYFGKRSEIRGGTTEAG